MGFYKKNIQIYNFIMNYMLPVTTICESSSGGRVTSDPMNDVGFRSSISQVIHDQCLLYFICASVFVNRSEVQKDA